MSDGNNYRRGTNEQGNNYTSYGNGRFSYKNVDSGGNTASRFYDTGNGHTFYEKKGSEGYKFHENQNQGFRDYIPRGGSGNSSKK